MAPLERADWCPPGAPGEEETTYPMGLGHQVKWFLWRGLGTGLSWGTGI